MANSFFQFKQFRINQEKASMKVTTDACILGAWTSVLMRNLKPVYMLDIGAGTGLLSLMIAQHCTAIIDAVEIDKDAAEECRENFEASPWRERLRVWHTDIMEFHPENNYDIIISNPPFYQNELTSASRGINLARHDEGLLLEQLITESDRLLGLEGHLFVLLPEQRVESFIQMALKSNLFVHHKMLMRQTESHDYFRGLLMLGREKKGVITHEFTIKVNGVYSEQFSYLMKDYYLA